MMVADNPAVLKEKLAEIFSHEFVNLSEPWEQSDWSKIYRVEFADLESMILKGTPRQRPESLTTAILHSYCPDLIPKYTIEDLIPQGHWRWFLLEDVGESNFNHIEQELAIKAAYQLGRLQKTVFHDLTLPKFLPHCRADQLYEALCGVCEWTSRSLPLENQDQLSSIQTRLAESRNIFRVLEEKLAVLPSTCVHGDLWSGNIVTKHENLCFIDWGDALWGVGSISIVHFLLTIGADHSDCAQAVWDAYAQGWEHEITAEYIRASQAAEVVGSLVVDAEIARSIGQAAAGTPGLFPGLELLLAELEKYK